MNAAEETLRVRERAGLFRLEDRGIGVVSGEDRVRWLDGMVSNDVKSLEAGTARSGCYAALLTAKGRIVADLQILSRPGALWFETEGWALPGVIARLDKYVIADDVQLEDQSAEFARFGIEGAAAPAILAEAAGRELALARDACVDADVAGAPVLVARFGWSGERAFQIYSPTTAADDVIGALRDAGRSHGMVEAGPEVLEILRIEAGRPRLGAELDETVLPAEARLERAISTSKGCFVGQEVVERMRSRGQVKHLLVGLRFDGAEAPPVAAEVSAGSKRVGEITSACVSAQAGTIALAYVRRPHDAPDGEVSVEGTRARVAELPFVQPGSGRA